MDYKMIGCCSIMAIAIMQFLYLLWDIFLMNPPAILVTGVGLLVDLLIIRLFFIDEANELYDKIMKKNT